MRWSGAEPWRWARWLLLALVAVWAVVTALGTSERFVTTPVVLVMLASLVAAPRWPIAALVAVFAGMFAWGSLVADGSGDDPFIAMLVLASYGVGRHARMSRQPWAAAGVLLLLATNVTEDGRDVAVADVVFPVLLSAGPWLLGLVVQLALRREGAAVAYARQVDAVREEELRRATAEERLRIARELHDQVAHSISAVSLQAQVLRRGVSAGGSVAAGDLHDIETTAQQAMTDLRRLLGLLRTDEAPLEPQRGLGDVDQLVAEARSVGQQVRLTRAGEDRPVGPVLGAAAYRILQEALTNARRHGRGETEVVLTRSPDHLEILVANQVGSHVSHGPGHGTTGMRERVALFGGDLSCGAQGDRWIVRALLPTSSTEVMS
jgi:signal transduction histidine kinase